MAPPGGGTGATGLQQDGRSENARQGNAERIVEDRRQQFRDVCGKCGARRVDQQIGLEETPDAYVARIVAVFRQVRRVLAAHGTCFINLGDSYMNKQRQMMPARVALALQADGWWLRSEIVWAKLNPMPASVTDRPTDAHEMVYLLTKQPRYWFDQEAVREKADWARWGDQTTPKHADSDNGAWMKPKSKEELEAKAAQGRNVRSVWTIATQPYPEAHFATYPEELVRRCVLAGCPERVCTTCGKPSERQVEVESSWRSRAEQGAIRGNLAPERLVGAGTQRAVHGAGVSHDLDSRRREVVGWSDCGHNTWRPGRVLDPFVGSGTTCKVARDHGRHSVGIDLNTDYLELAARRLQQLSLLTDAAR